MKKLFFAGLLLSAISVYAQSAFEGIINLSTFTKERQDKATVKWFIKGGSHKLLVNGVAAEKNYSSAIYFLKGDDKIRLVSEIGGETGVISVPVEQIAHEIPFTEGKLTESKETKKISGYTCKNVTFEMPAGKAVFWMTDDVNIGSEDIPVLLRTNGVFRMLQEKGIKGFPAEVIVTGADGTVTFSQTVQSISKTSVSDSEFKIPADAKDGEELLKKSIKAE